MNAEVMRILGGTMSKRDLAELLSEFISRRLNLEGETVLFLEAYRPEGQFLERIEITR